MPHQFYLRRRLFALVIAREFDGNREDEPSSLRIVAARFLKMGISCFIVYSGLKMYYLVKISLTEIGAGVGIFPGSRRIVPDPGF